MGNPTVGGAGAPRATGIAGGFVLISVPTLMAAWRACRSRPLGAADFRAYLACLEVAARRRPAGDGRAPSFGFAEVARLLGVAERRARVSVRRLAAAGLLEWSASAVGFPAPPAGESAGDGPLADTIGGGRGDLAVPRRLLRHLARGGRPALVATALGLLLRCLSRRRAGFDGRGRAKASWIARAFGVDARAVKCARKELVALGWVAAEPSSQAAENRWGRAYRVDLGWAGPPVPAGEAAGAACRESPPPLAPGCRESPPLLVDRDPPGEEIRNQDPAPGGPAGTSPGGPGGGEAPGLAGAARLGRATPVAPPDRPGPAHPPTPTRTPPPPRLDDVRPEDLRDVGRTLVLHDQAVSRKLAGPSEHGRLRFLALAEHAMAVGTVNPGGLFASLVRAGRWGYATLGDEDAARRRLRAHLRGEPVPSRAVVAAGRLSPSRPVPGLSEDARLVREVRAAMMRAGIPRDPFPLVRARDPGWTRGRWDAALAELGASGAGPPRPG
jgi:hypothetical protein